MLPTALLLAAAVLSLVLLVRTPAAPDSYLSSREAHAAHVAMNGTMAAMAAPALGPDGWTAIVAVLAAGDLVLAVRCLDAVRRGEGERAAGSLYHLFGMAVMTAATVPMRAMAAHGAMAMPPVRPSALAMIAAAVFAVDGAATLLLSFAFPQALFRMKRRLEPDGSSPALREVRLAALPHVVMDVGMIMMLL